MVMVLGAVFTVTGPGVATTGVILVGMARFVTREKTPARAVPAAVPAGAAD